MVTLVYTGSMLRPATFALVLALGGCASPLYTSTPYALQDAGTIPRDDRGEPILSEIKPAPGTPAPPAPPAAPIPSGPR